MKSRKIAIFASGSGSNAENIIRYFDADPLVSIALVLSSRADAYVVQRAEKLGIPVRIVPKSDFPEPGNVIGLLRSFHVDFIVLAGFLLKIPDELLEAYPHAIVNIHPSLLPKYGGKGMYGSRVHEAVQANGETESGITIHYLNGAYDEGDIVFQATCPVLPEDTPERIAEKVHALEHRHYPAVIAELLKTVE